MTGATLDPDIVRILQIAGLDPAKASAREIAMADRFHMRFPENPRKAGLEFQFYLKGGGK